MSYIYKITNDINDKVYIGKTNFSIEKRFKEHCQDAFKPRTEKRPLYDAMQKYGIEHFTIELIEETDNPIEREIYWIGYYDGYTQGYNATLGGDGKQIYNHQDIIDYLICHPYPCDAALKFGCSRDLVYDIAKQHHIEIKNKSYETLKEKTSKSIVAYTKNGQIVREFSSTVEAAQWCFDEKKCATLNSGVRSHIAEVANGKRKSAYGLLWKYKD